jgi:hypothetical protein
VTGLLWQSSLIQTNISLWLYISNFWKRHSRSIKALTVGWVRVASSADEFSVAKPETAIAAMNEAVVRRLKFTLVFPVLICCPYSIE